MRAQALAKSSTVCGTASLVVISKMSVSHSNRSPGYSVIRRLGRSTMPSNGGPGYRPAEREIRKTYLRRHNRSFPPPVIHSLLPMRLRRLGPRGASSPCDANLRLQPPPFSKDPFGVLRGAEVDQST